MNKIKILCIVVATVLTPFLFSCGGFGFAYEKKLTDKFYLIAADERAQMNIAYQSHDNQYSTVVNETVVAIGYNDSFIIAKQHPRKLLEKINRDSTFYYIVEVGRAIRERKDFISKIDSFTYRQHYTDNKGRDSQGPEKTEIFKSYYFPLPPERLTYGNYLKRRKTLNVPDTLNFTIIFPDLR